MPKSLGQLMTETIANINSMEIHVCAANEYDSTTLVPTIEHPNEHTFYLVPDGSSTDLYTEWVRIGSSWEKFGAARVDLSGKADKNNTDLTGSLSLGRIPTTTIGMNSIALGSGIQATASYSVAFGSGTTASGAGAFAEGGGSTASGQYAHAEGSSTASGMNSHAEGASYASGSTSHAEGTGTVTGDYAHAEGKGGTFTLNGTSYTSGATGQSSHSEGDQTLASGDHAHAEGSHTIASLSDAHAEGSQTIANGYNSHAEGLYTVASGVNSHAEGCNTSAKGYSSHTAGYQTIAIGENSYVAGKYNVIDSYTNWPEWTANTEYAVGDKVKQTSVSNNTTTVTGLICKTAHTSSSIFSISKWNQDKAYNYSTIIGNGTADNARSNAYALDWDGNGHFKGNVYVGANADSSGGNKVATEAYVNARIPAPPSSDGTYTLQVTIADGEATYAWV